MAGATARKGPIHGINIAPLVDIFLVLLVIVMLTGALVRPDALSPELPRSTRSGKATEGSSEVGLSSDGSLALDGIRLGQEELLARLSESVASDSGHAVLLSADASLAYAKVVEAIDLVQGAGIRRYALRVRKEP